MEYSNIHAQHHHHHQLQQQINIGVVQSASSLPIISPSTLITATSNCNLNPSQLILNNIGNDVYPSAETIPNSRLWQYSPITTSTFTSHQSFNYGDHHHARSSALMTRQPSTAGNESPLTNIKEEEPNSDPFSKLKIAKAIYKQHQNENNHTFRGLMSTNYSSSSSPYSALDHELYSNISQSNRMNINASFGHVFHPSTITNSTSRSTATRSSIASIMIPSLVLSSEGFMNNNTQLALDMLSDRSQSYSPSSQHSNNSNISGLYRDQQPIMSHGHHHDMQESRSSPSNYNTQLALDILSDRSQSYSPSSQHSNNSNISGLYRDQQPIMSHGHHHDMQESRSSPSNCTNNNTTSVFFNEITKTRRPSNFSQPKESHAEANKKSKSLLRSSNPPLKVRKEKLGDRIAALHRLVAPFGKTDTASVLTEAIGYIQFLHDQVQTLSMPYMKSLQSKPSRKIQQVHGMRKEEETELKMDLRSRELCLVPQSCAAYLNGFD